MAVSTVHKQDNNGLTIDATISAQQTAVNGLSPTGANAPLYKIAAEALRKAQIEAVNYYINNGRIDPATILSTLS